MYITRSFCTVDYTKCNNPTCLISYFNNSDDYHREDGPAVTVTCCNKEYWYLYGDRYRYPNEMPLNLFISYCKWEYKKNGN